MKYTKRLAYEYLPEQDAYAVTGYGKANREATLVIPAEHEGKPVIRIAENAFACSSIWSGDNKILRRAVLPDTITEIGAGAFSNNFKLGRVTFGTSLQSIGNAAFCWCRRLTAIRLPDTLQTIGSGAFCKCRHLRAVTFGKDISVIEKGAFSLCKRLRKAKFPMWATNGFPNGCDTPVDFSNPRKAAKSLKNSDYKSWRMEDREAE